MARMSRLVQVFNVQCVMCNRAAGQLLDGVFLPHERNPRPVATKTGSRCGGCGGNLYLEPDEAITPYMAAQLTGQQVAAAASARALRAA